jgi:hypothetical protein
VVWSFDTPEYKAILGTQLGKGAAALVLSAFPRVRFVFNIKPNLHDNFPPDDDFGDTMCTSGERRQKAGSQDFQRSPASLNHVVWSFDTPEYKAILGTQLGKEWPCIRGYQSSRPHDLVMLEIAGNPENQLVEF